MRTLAHKPVFKSSPGMAGIAIAVGYMNGLLNISVSCEAEITAYIYHFEVDLRYLML